MPLGELYANFVNQSLQLRTTNATIAAATAEDGQREWQLPELGFGDPSVPGLAESYSRVEIANAYNSIITNPAGTVGDSMSAKLQSDQVAAQERAYRLRLAGPVRCAMHAAGRRSAHGRPEGTLGRVESYAQDLIVAGTAGYLPPANGTNLLLPQAAGSG